MKIQVMCHSGCRVDEIPRRIAFGDLTIDVAAVIDRWLSPDHRYFKCIGSDRSCTLIRQDMETLGWELVFYRQAGAKALPYEIFDRQDGI